VSKQGLGNYRERERERERKREREKLAMSFIIHAMLMATGISHSESHFSRSIRARVFSLQHHTSFFSLPSDIHLHGILGFTALPFAYGFLNRSRLLLEKKMYGGT